MATQRLKTVAAGLAGGLVEDRKKGNYFGTEIDRKWWKRYRRDGLFARGNGSFWLDEAGIRFHKLLTREPFLIPWEEIRGAELGKWHAGRWAMGRPVLKVDFERGSRQHPHPRLPPGRGKGFLQKGQGLSRPSRVGR